ncbi:MAG: hypothetical protein J5I90_21260, partial [Caldilineales bacterium]|nr:hypothetical protein [Caldilineales bacterium]
EGNQLFLRQLAQGFLGHGGAVYTILFIRATHFVRRRQGEQLQKNIICIKRTLLLKMYGICGKVGCEIVSEW